LLVYVAAAHCVSSTSVEAPLMVPPADVTVTSTGPQGAVLVNSTVQYTLNYANIGAAEAKQEIISAEITRFTIHLLRYRLDRKDQTPLDRI
jgi:hypothetical protein